MTDQLHDEIVDANTEPRGINRRRMFLAGAGLAGAAALTKVGAAEAATEVVDTEQDNLSEATTSITNTGTSLDRGSNAFKGVISNAGNNSHAILGTTAGSGHAIAGVVGDATTAPDPAVAATWGLQWGAAAAVEGDNRAANQPIAGPANGVKGIVVDATNGSHAVFGTTNGAGHAIAGETPPEVPDAPGSTTMVPNTNTTAATWGKHNGAGAGIGGLSVGGYGGEFQGGLGKASVRLIPDAGAETGPPADAMHSVGELFVDGEGDLYYNTAAGANFTRLNGQGGVVMLPDAQRAFDSRVAYLTPANSNKGTFAADETRVVDIGEFTDVPPTATGAIINLTVDRATSSGYATVFNGATADADRPNASSINWLPYTVTIANGIIVPVSADNEVKIFTLQPTEVLIDVVGYIS